MRVRGLVRVAVWALASLIWVPAGAQVPEPGVEPAAQAHALRQVISMMESEAAELEPRLETARAQMADLNRQIAEATARLETGRADLDRLQNEQDSIKGEIAEAQAERDRQTGAIAAAQQELSDLTARIDESRAEAQVAQTAVQDAQADLADVTSQIETARTEQAALTARQEAVEASLARSQDLAGQIAAQEHRLGELTEGVRQLTAELTALTRVRDAALDQPDPEPRPDTPPRADTAAADPSPQGPRRDPGLVDAALSQAPALPAAAQRARLRGLLIDGHCTTDALRQVQDPINRQTLLVLVERLGGC